MLEACLEEASCPGTNLVEIMIILLYPNDIVLFVRCLFHLGRKLRVLRDFYTSFGICTNTTYTNFVYANNNLEEVYHTSILELTFIASSRRINGGWKAYFDLKVV
jgi:hypothetical protein